MRVKIKLVHSDAKLPKYAKDGDACMDLIAVEREYKYVEQRLLYIQYDTGLQMEIPEGFEGQIRARSSVSKKGMILCNGIGTIDSGYRGNIMLRFYPVMPGHGSYEVGEAVGQLIIKPVAKVMWEEVTELEDTDRGSGGFGSTDTP